VEGLDDLEEDGRGEGEDGGDVVAEEHLEEGEVRLGQLCVFGVCVCVGGGEGSGGVLAAAAAAAAKGWRWCS
jgi:hypothetical protein